MGRGFFLPFLLRGQSHKPFKVCSKAVHTFFHRLRYTMIVGRERHQPHRHPFLQCFLSFTFSFYPLFHFALACALFSIPPLWKTGRFPCLRKNMPETILSQHIYNLFTLCTRRQGILSMSIREAAIPGRQPTDLLFLFLPPFFKSV